jgi:hypothetical protein
MKEGTVGFKSVWGFDPEEVIRAQKLSRTQPEPAELGYDAHEEQAALVPSEIDSQIYELRRIFRL